ncbi:MAG: hypothetical protein J6V07_03595, partial [Clostridia bacterium]|nr:hypothetical protein [Clostridia bacterium]
VTAANLYERAEGITSFNYVTTYKGDDVTEADYAVEYSYVYDIIVDGETNDFAIRTKKLGDTISAKEVYGLFAEMDAYKNDAVVAKVVATTAE